MNPAETLISRFRPVMTAAVEPSGPSEHAEVLHQLCLADGLLELLDWTSQGIGADPLACMWLGSLRWHRLVTGAFPAGAPAPPSRRVDEQLHRLLDAGGVDLIPETGSGSIAGLGTGEMGYPSAPAQPDAHDAAALLRAVPVGLVPYIEEHTRRAWARQAVSLTHGHPDLVQRAEELAQLVHELASVAAAPAASGGGAIAGTELLDDLQDHRVRAILSRQLEAAGGHESPAQPGAGSPVLDVVSDLAQQWEQVTRAK